MQCALSAEVVVLSFIDTTSYLHECLKSLLRELNGIATKLQYNIQTKHMMLNTNNLAKAGIQEQGTRLLQTR